MSDRYAGLTVTFESSLHEDLVRDIITAIKLMPGVVKVDRLVNDPAYHAAYVMAKEELKTKIWEALK